MKTKRTICILLSAVFMGSMLTVPVQAMDGLAQPYYIPEDTEAFSREDWKTTHGGEYLELCGRYYAEGYGLELEIFGIAEIKGSKDLVMNATIFDYTSGQYVIRGAMDMPEGSDTAQERNGRMTISKESDTSLRVDFSDTFLQEELKEKWLSIYKEATSVTFTDIWELADETAEDHWSGTYQARRPDEDRDYYLSVKQLYGTHDFMTYLQSTCYNSYYSEDDENYGSYFFYTESEDGNMLLHEYAPGVTSSVPTYAVWVKDSDGDIHQYDYTLREEELANPPEYSSYGIYYHFADVPVWERG